MPEIGTHLNFFAYLKDGIRRIPLTRELQEELTNRFEGKIQSFVPDEEGKIIDFKENPGYKPDNDERFVIEGFRLPPSIINSIRNPLGFLTLTEADYEDIKAIYCGRCDNNGCIVAFTIFDSRKIIANRCGKHILYSEDVYQRPTRRAIPNIFRRMEIKMIVIDEKIDALYKDGNLYFRSFHNVKRIFGDQMAEYYREATDDEVKEFGNKLFGMSEIPEDFLDSQSRKLIFWIVKNYQNFDYERIKNAGEEFGLTLEIDAETGKLVLPQEKKEFKQLLRLLNSDMYESPITGEKFLTNSKKRLQL